MKSDLIMLINFSVHNFVQYCCLAILDGLIFLSSSLIASSEMGLQLMHTQMLSLIFDIIAASREVKQLSTNIQNVSSVNEICVPVWLEKNRGFYAKQSQMRMSFQFLLYIWTILFYTVFLMLTQLVTVSTSMSIIWLNYIGFRESYKNCMSFSAASILLHLII
ncbi:Hypothetical_protein [Hexamita inflata]|uniref:Hypothetical_protein n=1 Tax=Hexamita inflata TaxID=28002 RepID=A0ABP1HWM4_9EUKA